MKSIKFILTLFVASTVIFQCSKDNEPSLKSQKIKLLASDVWVTESVLNSEDGDLTFQYTDFTIAFVKNGDAGFDGDYYLTGGGHAFPELTGKWKFSKDVTKLVLQNGREMGIMLTAGSLTLTFHMDASGGRTRGLGGDFIFNLKKQN